jgi:predicted DNA-binding WGR domain protein
MIAQPYHLYIERTDAEKNMARFYAISIEPTLFGEACLMRRWGRIGTRGQLKVHHFEREEEAVELFLELISRKRARGYCPAVRAERGNAPTYTKNLQRCETIFQPELVTFVASPDGTIWIG